MNINSKINDIQMLAMFSILQNTLYENIKQNLRSSLDARDYIASNKQIMKYYKHTIKYLEAVLEMHAHFAKKAEKKQKIMQLLHGMHHTLMQISPLYTQKHIIAPPQFSVYSYKGNAQLPKAPLAPKPMMPYINPSNYLMGAQPMFKMSGSIYPSDLKLTGGEQNNNSKKVPEFNFYKTVYDGNNNPVEWIMTQPELNLHVNDLSNKFIHMANKYCQSKGIPFSSHNCLRLIGSALDTFDNIQCSGKNFGECVDSGVRKLYSQLGNTIGQYDKEQIEEIVKSSIEKLKEQLQEDEKIIGKDEDQLRKKIKENQTKYDELLKTSIDLAKENIKIGKDVDTTIDDTKKTINPPNKELDLIKQTGQITQNDEENSEEIDLTNENTSKRITEY